MDDTQQMLVNELERLDRAVKKRRERIDRVVEKARQSDPHRYVIDLPVPVININDEISSDNFSPVTRTFLIDKASKFRVREIAATVMATGTLTDTGVAATIALAAFSRALSFEWMVRDTYTDSGWSNIFLPDLALASGKNGGIRLARRVALPPGTAVEVTIMPLQTALNVPVLVEDVTEYTVQFSFIGDEVYE